MAPRYSQVEDDVYTASRLARPNSLGLSVLEVCDTCGEAVIATLPGQWWPLWLCWSCTVREWSDMDDFDRSFLRQQAVEL